MLMITSIEFDIRHPFSDIKAGAPCFDNNKMNEKCIASQNIKHMLVLAR